MRPLVSAMLVGVLLGSPLLAACGDSGTDPGADPTTTEGSTVTTGPTDPAAAQQAVDDAVGTVLDVALGELSDLRATSGTGGFEPCAGKARYLASLQFVGSAGPAAGGATDQEDAVFRRALQRAGLEVAASPDGTGGLVGSAPGMDDALSAAPARTAAGGIRTLTIRSECLDADYSPALGEDRDYTAMIPTARRYP